MLHVISCIPMHSKGSENMCVCDDVDVDEVYEPPAKKYSVHPVAMTNFGAGDVQPPIDPDIIVEFMSGPFLKTCTDSQKSINNKLLTTSPHNEPSANHLVQQNSVDVCVENLSNLNLEQCSFHSAVTDESAIVESDNIVESTKTVEGAKTFSDTFRDSCSKEKLAASENMNEMENPVIRATDLFCPKMSFKGDHRFKLEPHQTLLHIEHFRIKEDTHLNDFFDHIPLKSSSSAVPMNSGLSFLVASLIEEGSFDLKVLDCLTSNMLIYPEPGLTNILLRTLLQENESEFTKYSTFWYLKRLLDVYTPDKTSHEYYYEVLFSKNAFQWEEILQVIESSTSCDESRIGFLNIFVNILSKDFETSEMNDFLSIRAMHKQALVSLLFFTPRNMEQKKLNSLLRFINILVRPSLEKQQVILLKILMHLLYLFSETVRLRCICHKSAALSSVKLNFISNEIFVHCRDALGDKDRSRIFLDILAPVWLKIKVAESLLLRLVSQVPLHCSEVPVTLRKIVRQCIFPPTGKLLTAREKNLSSEKNGIDENSNPLSLSHVMKPNPKGETLIHVQCLRNKPEVLRELLSIPGVDINMRDYAGWTPLHECCNYGYLECAKLLVTWFPPDEKHVTVFADHLTAANLSASNDGTTPLHEAVMSNHAEVVRLLLEFGGPSLIKMKDNQGKTPHDYATNTLLMSVLEDARQDTAWKRKQRFDQDDFCYLGDLSYSERICPKFEDPNDYSYYAHLLDILLKEYLRFSDLLQLQKFVQESFAPGNLKSLVEKFLINSGCTPDTNNIVNCLDDLFVLQSLPEVLKTFCGQVRNISSSNEAQECLLSLEFLLCWL